ncbi:uncharacterized protein LOC114938913 isoform X2 [Nylanderia fulva]|nr:uncharacterized protein LOC114938913 isoform X2 [Nylanderia fulva]
MLAKGEDPAAIEEMIIETIDGKRRNEESAKKRKEEPIEGVEDNDETERSKGGGEERRIMTCHQFTRASDGESSSNLKGSSRHQTTALISSFASSRTKPKTYLYLKSNKVDPIRDACVSNENPGLEIAASRTLVCPAVQKDEYVELPKSIEHRMKDVCSHCKRLQSSTPTSANSCNIFKDKKGKYFCEFCAPTDRLISRVEVKDLKKLRCANCRLSLRPRGFKINKLKPDACPKCGQSQRQTAASSPSSM